MSVNTVLLGLDLAGSYKNYSGFFLGFSKKSSITFGLFKKDNKLLDVLKKKVRKEDFLIVSIDSPLTYEKIPFRDCEIELMKKYKVRLLPLSLKSMRILYNRTMLLTSFIRKFYPNSIFLETHPRTIELAYNLSFLRKFFKSKDIYDAFLCYLTSYSFYVEEFEYIGNQIFIPSKSFIEKFLKRIINTFILNKHLY